MIGIGSDSDYVGWLCLELLGGVLGLSALVPSSGPLELQFTRATELAPYVALLKWDKAEFGHKVASIRDLVLNLDGPEDATWLTDVAVLNGLYRDVPVLFPRLEHLTVVWRLRDESDVNNGQMIGDMKALSEALPSLRHVEVATSSSGAERAAFRALFQAGVRVQVWETYDRQDEDYDPEEFDEDSLDGWWEAGKRQPIDTPMKD